MFEPIKLQNSASQLNIQMSEIIELSSDLKTVFQKFHIHKAKQIDSNEKKAIVFYVPMPQLLQFQKNQLSKVVRELEKKFSGGKHVVFIGERRILLKPTRNSHIKSNKQKRPQSRTLTAVYDGILEDIVFPAEIVGKRIRTKLDGKRVVKVHLDKYQKTTVEHKVDTFAAIYKKLTGREVIFEFPEYDIM